MSYGLNVYMRASTCLRTLENLIGKEVMLRVMRAFHTRFRYRHPTSGDFIATANEVSGRDLELVLRRIVLRHQGMGLRGRPGALQ